MADKSEDQLYSQARRELEQKRVAQQIWEKARTKAGDDPHRLAAHYIALRVAQLRRKLASTPLSQDLASSETAELTVLNPDALEAALRSSEAPETPETPESSPLPADGVFPAENAVALAGDAPAPVWDARKPRLIAAGLAALALLALLIWQLTNSSGGDVAGGDAADKNAGRETVLFRGDAARTGVYAQAGPLQFNEILWNFKGEDEFTSPPVIAGDTLFIGGNDGHVYALDLADGTERWRFKSREAIVAAPAVDADSVYVSGLDGHLHALDRSDGQEKWRFQAQGAIFASPAIVDGTVYIGSQNSQVYAINGENGQLHWQAEIGGGGIDASPAVAGDVVYVGSLDGHLYALDRESSDPLWRFKTGGAIAATPTVSGDTVYAGSTDGYLYAIERGNGRQKWRARTTDIVVAPACVVPAANKDELAVAASSTAEAPETGESGARLSDEADIAQGESASEASVYVLSVDGALRALDHDGHTVWEFDSESKTFTAPVVADRLIYFSTTDGYMYALDRDDGSTRWRAMFSSQPLSSPITAAGTIYFGSADQHVYAVK